MPRKSEKRDQNLDCPAVREYRSIVHLQMNYLQREFVVDKVSCCERGLAIWRETLKEFMLKGMNPKNIPYMVKIWENQFWGVEDARFQAYQPNGNSVNANGNH